MTYFEWIQVVLQAGMLGAAGWALIIARGQLKSASSQLKEMAEASKASARANENANIMAVLALESSIADARYHLIESAAKLNQYEDDEKAFEFAQAVYEAAGEQYLNATDRLCACIIRKQVDEQVYRRDYRLWVAEIVDKYQSELGPGTRHQNILTVHKAWSDDKSAVDPTIKTPC